MDGVVNSLEFILCIVDCIILLILLFGDSVVKEAVDVELCRA